MLLVNGARGIGTGFSTFIPACNPLVIIDYMRAQIQGTDLPTLEPYYRGSKCPFSKSSAKKYVSNSVYTAVPRKKDCIRVTDLCVGLWTDDFKATLERLIAVPKDQRIVKSYKDDSTDKDVDITVIS